MLSVFPLSILFKKSSLRCRIIYAFKSYFYHFIFLIIKTKKTFIIMQEKLLVFAFLLEADFLHFKLKGNLQGK